MVKGVLQMKKILVLHTGGTISMSENEAGEVIQNEENPLLKLTHHFDFEIDLVVEDIFNLPSPHIAPQHMLQLKNRIQKAVNEEKN